MTIKELSGIYFINTARGKVLWNNKVNRPRFWGCCNGCGNLNGPHLVITEAQIQQDCIQCRAEHAHEQAHEYSHERIQKYTEPTHAFAS